MFLVLLWAPVRSETTSFRSLVRVVQAVQFNLFFSLEHVTHFKRARGMWLLCALVPEDQGFLDRMVSLLHLQPSLLMSPSLCQNRTAQAAWAQEAYAGAVKLVVSSFNPLALQMSIFKARVGRSGRAPFRAIFACRLCLVASHRHPARPGAEREVRSQDVM